MTMAHRLCDIVHGPLWSQKELDLFFSSPNACSSFPNSICVPVGVGFNCECKVGFIRDDDKLCTLCSTNFIPLGILLNH